MERRILVSFCTKNVISGVLRHRMKPRSAEDASRTANCVRHCTDVSSATSMQLAHTEDANAKSRFCSTSANVANQLGLNRYMFVSPTLKVIARFATSPSRVEF